MTLSSISGLAARTASYSRSLHDAGKRISAWYYLYRRAEASSHEIVLRGEERYGKFWEFTCVSAN